MRAPLPALLLSLALAVSLGGAARALEEAPEPPAGFVVTLGQLATLYYFFHFLILIPLLGKIERPRPLPISIAEAVLGPRPGVAGEDD